MGRYRKKPVEVEAVQWTGGNIVECVDLLGEGCRANGLGLRCRFYGLDVPRHSWVVREHEAFKHFSVLTPDIFEATYEKVGERE